MTRLLRVAGAQMGPIARDEPRQSAVTRMLALLERGGREIRGALALVKSFFVCGRFWWSGRPK